MTITMQEIEWYEQIRPESLTNEQYAKLCAAARRGVEAYAQLPEGMKHCTILFKECEKGHGELTATNWVQHPCLICRAEKAEAELAALKVERDSSQPNGAVLRCTKCNAETTIAFHYATGGDNEH